MNYPPIPTIEKMRKNEGPGAGFYWIRKEFESSNKSYFYTVNAALHGGLELVRFSDRANRRDNIHFESVEQAKWVRGALDGMISRMESTRALFDEADSAFDA